MPFPKYPDINLDLTDEMRENRLLVIETVVPMLIAAGVPLDDRFKFALAIAQAEEHLEELTKYVHVYQESEIILNLN